MRSDSSASSPLIELLREETRRYVRGYRSASLCAGLTVRGAHHVLPLRGHGTPPAENALYFLGTLTQVFTGSLLRLLADGDRARLDMPLSEVIPRPLLPDANAGTITLEQLARHTSGMPYLPPNLEVAAANPEDPFGHYSASLFGDFLRSYHPDSPPPRPASSSLLGMGVLGHALSRRAGVNYGHALRDWLFTPLKMTDTSMRVTDELAPRLLPGHSARGKRMAPWTFPALPGAAGLHSTVPDLLRFLDACLGGDEALSKSLKRTWDSGTEQGASPRKGLGWSLSQLQGHTIAWSSSVMGGYVGFLGLAPSANAGVVLLSDTAWSWFSAFRNRVPLEAPGLALLSRLLSESGSR
ncbi:serine hydrolase domain-containing protein [Myxococcus landrumensis]|uniref:Beta-lactamase family protein n=1 Tax=Myxococcus landrumensis TaxID=2813577 RepID=A0ABX7N644_9BACT|nr:serine hydrolase domain-containing protein [Myxococcus landrumus]QSQ13147.1 beta-lactamase family protein [Myxococcus landrumus]